MEFEVFGPFDVPRNHNGKVVSRDKDNKKQFWKDVDEVREGLSGACGCYIFGLSPAGGGPKPWYVGRTKASGGFAGECFQAHKIVHYDSALSGYKRATPQLTLIAKVTPTTKKFAKPNSNGHRDVEQLEEFLIGIAYAMNHDLENIKETAFLRDVIIHRVFNDPGRSGYPGDAPIALKRLLGL